MMRSRKLECGIAARLFGAADKPADVILGRL